MKPESPFAGDCFNIRLVLQEPSLMWQWLHRLPANVALFLAGVACAFTGGLLAGEFGPETEREFSVKRKEVFKFTEKPSVTRDGDRVTIAFASQDYCDATVAIEDAAGNIVRHLATGVLGPHAPAPFARNALKQTIVWDSKDDFGKYIDDHARYGVRVSLGLRARFEKNVHWHPYRCMGNDTAIAVDKDGVYVFQNNSMLNYLRKYDHKGNYVETLFPFAGGKVDKIKGLRWRTLPDGRRVPQKMQLPMSAGLFKVDSYYMGDMIARKGMLTLIGKRLFRIGTDGTTRGRELVGQKALIGKHLPHNAAASPDGKWLAMTHVFYKGAKYSQPNAVFRMPLEGDQWPKRYLGQGNSGCAKIGNVRDAKERDRLKAKARAIQDRFHSPASVAYDSKGRLYVADWDLDRIQVFTPDGKYERSILVNGPAQIQINPRTDEIYVFSWQVNCNVYNFKNPVYDKHVKQAARKFAPLDSAPGKHPKLLIEDGLHFPKPGRKSWASYITPAGHHPRFVVDFWSKPTRIWCVSREKYHDALYLLEEVNGRLKMVRNFDKEVNEAGLFQILPFFQRQFLFYDPKHNVLYLAEMNCNEMKNFSVMTAIDIKSGRARRVRLPDAVADAAIDAHGHIYLRIGGTVHRYLLKPWREVPYDYGEESGRAVSVIRTPGGGGSSKKYGAMGVSPDGEVVVSCVYRAKATRSGEGKTKAWAPKLYPGRPRSSQYVHVFDRHGMVKTPDVIRGGGNFTGGLDMDTNGNLYAAVRKHRMLDGKPYGGDGVGTLFKFDPLDSRFLTDQKASVELEQKPETRQTVKHAWVEGAHWAYGSAPVGSTGHCWCRHGKFKVDYFGRSFVPEPRRYSVAVLDGNGQLVMRIGQYGNTDDGKPLQKDPTMKHRSIGGDEVALCDAHYLTVHSDKRLFIADTGNGRVISVKLDYHRSERLALKQ